MKTLEIQLPDQTIEDLDRDPTELAAELRMAAAVKWYELGRVSQESPPHRIQIGCPSQSQRLPPPR